MRKFYRSNQFMLTMKQLEWLEKQPNKSEVIRLLIKMVMNNDQFEYYFNMLKSIKKRISNIQDQWDRELSSNTPEQNAKCRDKIDELEERQEAFLRKLIELKDFFKDEEED